MFDALGRLLIRLLVMAVIIGVVAEIVPGIDVNGGFGWLVWVALLFGFINTFVGFFLRLLTLPLIFLTLGLFLFVVNALLLAITAGLSDHLDIDSFGAALLGSLLISIFSFIADLVLPVGRRRAVAR